MIQEKEIVLECADGSNKTYYLSKFNAIDGREIATQYPISAMPKIGDYKTNEELMFKIMRFVYVDINGNKQALSTEQMIKNHVPEFETLIKLELAMMEYNCSFFANGKVSAFFDALTKNVQALITSMLTDLLAQSSQKGKQP
jgi:hypothetical protein